MTKQPRAKYVLPRDTQEVQAIAIGRALLIAYTAYPEHIATASTLDVLTVQQSRDVEQVKMLDGDVLTNDLQSFRAIFMAAFRRAYPLISQAYTPEAHRVWKDQHTYESRLAGMYLFGKQSLDILADKASQAG